MDVAAVMNGDGQMDPDILDRIVDPIVSGRADYAKGNRLASPEHRRGMPAFRTFGNFALSYLTKVASGYWRLLDPQNGYTAISRHALETLELDELYDRYGFVNHMLIRCNAAGLRVADVPMNARYGDERSHIRLSSFVPDVSEGEELAVRRQPAGVLEQVAEGRAQLAHGQLAIGVGGAAALGRRSGPVCDVEEGGAVGLLDIDVAEVAPRLGDHGGMLGARPRRPAGSGRVRTDTTP